MHDRYDEHFQADRIFLDRVFHSIVWGVALAIGGLECFALLKLFRVI